MRLKWTDLAADDLDHIEEYITTENSPSVAVDVVLRIINTVELVLGNHSEAGRPGRLQDTRELVIDGIPFVVIYRQVTALNQLQILRVLHDSQHWPQAR